MEVMETKKVRTTCFQERVGLWSEKRGSEVNDCRIRGQVGCSGQVQ